MYTKCQICEKNFRHKKGEYFYIQFKGTYDSSIWGRHDICCLDCFMKLFKVHNIFIEYFIDKKIKKWIG
jgi:hypothetical protein